jgi:primosomal protein N' (replication factor Y)
LKGFGLGTERVEEEAVKLFPEARIARMDRDTTTRKGSHANILGRFKRGEADILIGTQMVAKGLDFPNVTLVGVISADTSVNIPDFRAAERTFQLMTQVAGRAGRGEAPGEVVIQSFNPDHYSLQHVKSQDYRAFYGNEIDFRRELAYPPFSRLANLICSAPTSDSARDIATEVEKAFKRTLNKEVLIIGPSPCPLAKLKNTYRWHVLLKADTQTCLDQLVRFSVKKLDASVRRHLSIDIDPVSLA